MMPLVQSTYPEWIFRHDCDATENVRYDPGQRQVGRQDVIEDVYAQQQEKGVPLYEAVVQGRYATAEALAQALAQLSAASQLVREGSMPRGVVTGAGTRLPIGSCACPSACW